MNTNKLCNAMIHDFCLVSIFSNLSVFYLLILTKLLCSCILNKCKKKCSDYEWC